MKGLIFTYALTYGGSLAALINPFYGLLIYVCFAIIRPESLWHWSVPVGNYSRIIGIALLVGWALNGFGIWYFGRARMIVFSLCGALAWMAFAAFWALDQQLAWSRVEEYAKIVLPFLVGMTTIRSLKQVYILAWVIFASQGYLALEMNLAYLDGFNFVRESGFAQLDNNGVAITMVGGAGLAFFLGLCETNRIRQWIAFIAAGLMAHVVLFSNSRGGMLALLITGGLTFFLVRKKAAHYAFFALAVAIGLRLAGPETVDRFMTIFVDEEERDSSAESRIGLSKTCLEIMAKSPLAGVGPAHFRVHSHEYGWPRGKDGHTTWLQFGAETGIPGMLFLLTFYFATMHRGWRIIRADDPNLALHADIMRMVICSLIGYMIAAQFVTMYGVELSYYVALVGATTVKIASLATDEVYATQYFYAPARAI
ncbi:MAG: hypothetical protein DCC68_11150 [Planctomycetota bacterium]|nr:MAG: hypothetical protein DCC68_11150 [Planctomycetota bacterium]